jgi:Mg2+/citrate symporter
MKKLKFKKWVTNLLLTINIIIFVIMGSIQDFDICLTSLLFMIGLPIVFLVNSYLLIEYGGL